MKEFLTQYIETFLFKCGDRFVQPLNGDPGAFKFGYWQKLPEQIVRGLSLKEYDMYDDDCGCLYYYRLNFLNP